MDSSDKENMKTDNEKCQQVAPAGSDQCFKVAGKEKSGCRVQERRSYSRSQSRSPSSSSVSSSTSHSSSSTQSSSSSRSRSGHHYHHRHGVSQWTRRRSLSSPSSDWSRSRSRPRPHCHMTTSRSRCDRRHRHRSPPHHYRANSRSYSLTPSPCRRHRWRNSSSSHSRCRSRGPCFYSFGSSSRFISAPYRRSRSRSRSPVGTNIHLSLDDKRELLRIAQENAAKALGVEKLELPASVRPILGTQEQPKHMQQQGKDIETEDDVPSPKTSSKSKVIAFSIHNAVAKPTASRSPGSPQEGGNTRVDTTMGRDPYGQWVPIKACSFPIPLNKLAASKS